MQIVQEPELPPCDHAAETLSSQEAAGALCPTCGEQVRPERRPMPHVEAWIAAHPGQPFPAPAWLRELAAGHPESAARILFDYLGSRGVQVVEGNLPRVPALDAALVEVVVSKAAEPVWCPILRTLEVGSGLYALAGMSIEVAASAFGALDQSQGSVSASQDATQSDQRHDPGS